MIWGAKMCVLCCFLAFCSELNAQTGFYLSYACKKGDNEVRRIDPTKKNICLVTKPIVTLNDVLTLGEYHVVDGRHLFELRLTPTGHQKLLASMTTCPTIAFMVNNQIMFLIDSDGAEDIHETLRILQVGNVGDFRRLHQSVVQEMKALKEKRTTELSTRDGS